jgi:hypothetical protein
MINPSAYDELNENVREERVDITLLNDKVVVADSLYIKSDSASWTEVQKRRQRGYRQDKRWHEVKKWTVSTSKIKKIEVGGNRMQGTLGGIFYGFLAGASFGLIGGLTETGDESGFFNPEPEESAAMVGVLGAIIGLPIGFLVGGTDEYVLQDLDDNSENNN